MLLFLLKVLYFIAPAGFANLTPVIVKWVPFLNYPMDFGATLFGKRVFGKNKTWRGLVFGVGVGILTSYIQLVLFRFPLFRSLSIVHYPSYPFWLLGLLFGLGVILGDAIESFIKRQIGIKEGQRLLLFDQVDWVIGSFLFASIILHLHPLVFVWGIILGFFLHILGKNIGYYLGINKRRW